MSQLNRTASATIASGAAVSNAVCFGAGTLCAIQMPAAWTAADLTFQVSEDRGATWVELADANGTAIAVASPVAGSRLEVEPSDFKSATFLRLRSGTTGTPVNQAAERTVGLISRKF